MLVKTLPLLGAALLLVSCASSARRSAGGPDDPTAPEATTLPLRPTLVANARTFLPPAEPAGPMDHSPHAQMNHAAHGGAIDHSQHGGATQKAGGQYVCPMHPTVTSDKPDPCPKCGMKLEKAATPKAPGDAHQHHTP